MKRLFLLALICLVLLAAGVWAWDRHTQVEFQKAVQVAKSRFASNPQAFQSLVIQWRALHTGLNECGTPDPEPGLVHFAVIGLTSDGKYRIGEGLQDSTFSTLEEASRAAKVKPEALKQFVLSMKALSLVSVYQHQSETHFDDSAAAPIGVMSIPPACPLSNDYRTMAANGAHNQFAILEKLTDNWYFYEEKR